MDSNTEQIRAKASRGVDRSPLFAAIYVDETGGVETDRGVDWGALDEVADDDLAPDEVLEAIALRLREEAEEIDQKADQVRQVLAD